MCPVRKEHRLEKIYYNQPGAYFITVCTAGKKCLLSRIVGGDAHIAPFSELTSAGMVVQKYLCSIPGIDRYIIMPNHVHMILRISAKDISQGPMWEDAPMNADISKLVRSWKTLVSKELGISIWQRSYYDHIIRNEREYVAIAQYIADNPAKWKSDDYFQP